VTRGAGGGGEHAALAALDPAALAGDLVALVRVPSTTGDERAALELLAARAAALGLEPAVREHDLAALRADPGHPGEEAPRSELLDLRAVLPGAPAGAPRLALCGHVDVVDPGTVPWRHGTPWSGAVEDGLLFGRGSADMKAGVVAILHALAALRAAGVRPACAPELLAVGSEEDGGLGAFAALRADAAYAGCVITEPTGFDVVCAQAGALTFTGVVHGRAAHAAQRLEGASAIDRYLPVHRALHELEAERNRDVAHPLMARLALPYPVSVGRVSAGSWSSSVPDRLEFEGRAPVRVGETVAAARAAVERAVAAADPTAELAWTGGQFAAGETDPAHPLVAATSAAVRAERGTGGALAGVPWGADLRLFAARGIPVVMCGTEGIEVSHAVDEHVAVDQAVALAGVLVRLCCSYAG
jgi:acetylornithine deacetylase